MQSFNWIKEYQLFLLDFDGLLVNTEELHFQAYIRMCARHGIDLTWEFYYYAGLAHQSATGVREQLYVEFPILKSFDWNMLYEEKKQAFLDLLAEGATPLMPGVVEFLQALEHANIPSSVVTHSAVKLITVIREQNPILNTIPYWITREDYSKPKPDPEPYQVAIKKLAKDKDRVIGFEDSPRGLAALMGTRATPVLVCPPQYPYLKEVLNSQINYYPSFTAINDDNHP